MNLAGSTAAVGAILFILGFLISLLISFVSCSKVSPAISAKYGAIWMLLPTGLYALGNYSDTVRHVFSNVLQSSFGLSEDKAQIVGIGYLMMLGSWVMTTYIIHGTESDVCKPSVDEMKEFQDKLMKELKEKEAEKEENEKKPTT
jgi:hypothetical protein